MELKISVVELDPKLNWEKVFSQSFENYNNLIPFYLIAKDDPVKKEDLLIGFITGRDENLQLNIEVADSPVGDLFKRCHTNGWLKPATMACAVTDSPDKENPLPLEETIFIIQFEVAIEQRIYKKILRKEGFRFSFFQKGCIMAKEKELTKLEKLELLDKKIKSEMGKEIVLDEEDYLTIERWVDDSPVTNYILGGGWPKGRIGEIFGPESSGKSTFSILAGASVQKQGGFVLYIDAEHSFSKEWANTLGLKTDSSCFKLIQPENGEQGLELLSQYVETGAIDFAIVDSVPALVPKAEIEGDMGDAHMALLARLMGQGMRKLTPIVKKSNAFVLFINQIRFKVGFFMGSPEVQPGGNALKFASSIRLDIRKKEFITGTDADDVLGVLSKVKAIKNKTAAPGKKGEIEINYATGMDIYKQYLDFAVTYGIINKSGAWFDYNGERLGQGSNNSAKNSASEEWKSVFEEIRMKVNNLLLPGAVKPVVEKKSKKSKDEKSESSSVETSTNTSTEEQD